MYLPQNRPTRTTNVCTEFVFCMIIQSTSLITTLGGASEKCPYSRSVVIPEVSLYVYQLDGTLLWAWKFCRYSRSVVISAVVISQVDCIYSLQQTKVRVQSRLFEKWSSSDYSFVASGGTLSHYRRRELFD